MLTAAASRAFRSIRAAGATVRRGRNAVVGQALQNAAWSGPAIADAVEDDAEAVAAVGWNLHSSNTPPSRR
jgi:hypothetical protein